MSTIIQFRTTDPALMEAIAKQLQADLAQAGLADSLQVSEPELQASTQVMRGDPSMWATVVLTAVGAGGALSVLLSKEGVLASLASVLEKYIEGRKVDIVIDKGNGEKIQLSGPATEIQGILKQFR